MPDIDILIAATNKASGPINQVDKDVAGLDATAKKASGGGLSQLGSFLGNGLKVATVAGGAALAALGGAVAATGTNFNNMRQQAQIAFGTMLGSGEKAKSFLDDLQQFAAASPFEFPELVTASQKLIAMGFAAEDVKPTLTAIGDAVAGLGGGGEMVNRVTVALGQMSAKGKASGEEMMQLVESGIPAWDLLASAIGTDVGTAMDMVSKGAVSADTAVNALVTGMEDRFGGLMEAQSHTFGGLLSTIQDTFTQVSGTVMEPLFNQMTAGLQAIVDWTSKPEFTGGIKNLSEWLGKVATQTIDWATAVWPKVVTVVTEVYGVFQSLGSALGAVYTTVANLISPITDLVTQFVSWQDILVSVGLVLAATFGPGIAATLGPFVAAWAPVIGLFVGITAAVAALRTAWEQDWGGIQEKTQAAIDYISGVFEPLVTMIRTFSGDALGEIVAWVTGNQTQFFALGAIWETAKTTAFKLFDDIKAFVTDNLPSWIATLQQWGTAAWDWIVGAASTAVTKLSEWGSALIGWVADNLPDWIATLYEWGTAAVNWIADALPNAIDKLTDFIAGVREQGKNSGTPAFVQMAAEWATKLWTWITDDLIPKVGPAFMQYIDALGGLGGNLLTSLGGLARELGETLWQWIQKAIPPAMTKLGEWGGKLWGWIKDNAPTWYEKLKLWATAAWEWITKIAIPEALKKLGEWGSKLWGWVKENAPVWYEKLKGWATSAWEWITKIAIPEALKKLGEWGTALWGWVTENAPKWYEKLKEWGAAAWQWITEIAIPEAKTKLGEWFTTLKDWLTENWPKWQDQLVKAGSDMMQWVWDGVEILWIRFHQWFFGETAFGGIVGDILTMLGVQLGPAYGILNDHGKNIAYSLNEGSRYGLSALQQTGADMGDAISNGLQTSMDMHSPSRRMWGYGEDIAAGLAGSLHASAAGLKSEAQYVAEQIAEGFKASQGRINAEVNSIMGSLTTQMAQLKGAMVKGMEELLKAPAANGMVFLPGVTNLPKGSTTPSPISAATTVPTAPAITTLGQALGTNTTTASALGQTVDLLGGLKLQTVDLAQTKANTEKALETSAQKLSDFIAGIGDFLTSTLTGANSVFGYFKYQEEKAYGAGNLQEYLKSETNDTKSALKSLYQGLQNSVADILGVSSSDLNVTGATSQRLVDRISSLVSGTNAGTNMDFISSLLQSAVDFRNLANYGTGANYYANVLPTDARLTGGNSSTNTTYNISVQGTGNAANDVMGLVQLLGSLQAGAVA